MRLAEAITTPQRGGRPCSVGLVLQLIDDDDPDLGADLRSWLDGTHLVDVSDFQVIRVFESLGHDVSTAQLGKHRRRMRGLGNSCRCPK